MTTFDEERARDFAAYDLLKEEIRKKYRGQYVVIGGGKLIKVTLDFDEACEAAKPYRHCLVFQAGNEPPRDVVHIRWLAH